MIVAVVNAGSWRHWIQITAITAMGALIRIIPVASAGFPLNDGGMFAAMMQTIQENNFGLPNFVVYNGHAIPFAYPPLGLYLGGAASSLTGWSIPMVEQVVPWTASVLTIPIAYWTFRPMFRDRGPALVALFIFAVMPRSYEWVIAGGGITRSFGTLFAILAIGIAWRAGRTIGRRWPLFGGIALGLCGLSHPQAAVFAIVSVIFIVLTGSLSPRQRLEQLVLFGVISAILVSPWLGVTVARHGIGTLLAAATTGGSPIDGFLYLISVRVTDGLFEILGFVCIFGLIVSGLKRQWLFPAWAILVLVTSARSGPSYATVPLSGAGAFGVQQVLQLAKGSRLASAGGAARTKQAISAGLVILAILAVGDSVLSPNSAVSPLRPISRTEQMAIEWLGDNAPTDAQILVMSGEPWELDAIGEWLPFLTGGKSVATVQGTEWLDFGEFDLATRRYHWLLNCAALTDIDCVGEWSRVVGGVDYVVLADGHAATAAGHPCCLAVAGRLTAAGAELVFGASDIQVFRYRTKAGALPPADR